MQHFARCAKLFLSLAVFSLLVLAANDANAASISIVNQSASEIHGIYISSSDSSDWEENIIDGYVLPSGNELDITIPNYRQFDVRVEDGSGNFEEYEGFPGNTRKIYIQGGGDSEFE